jgi:hypothetical protein
MSTKLPSPKSLVTLSAVAVTSVTFAADGGAAISWQALDANGKPAGPGPLGGGGRLVVAATSAAGLLASKSAVAQLLAAAEAEVIASLSAPAPAPAMPDRAFQSPRART